MYTKREDLTFTREDAINNNIDLVYQMAHRYEKISPFDDLVSAGKVGILTAYDSYDPTKAKFITHAYNIIKKYMKKQNRQDQKYVSMVDIVKKGGSTGSTSNDDIAHANIADNVIFDEVYEEDYLIIDDVDKVKELFKSELTEREQFILNQRFFSDSNKTTYKTISKELGISIPWCTQTEKSALVKLRRGLEA